MSFPRSGWKEPATGGLEWYPLLLCIIILQTCGVCHSLELCNLTLGSQQLCRGCSSSRHQSPAGMPVWGYLQLVVSKHLGAKVPRFVVCRKSGPCSVRFHLSWEVAVAVTAPSCPVAVLLMVLLQEFFLWWQRRRGGLKTGIIIPT